MSVVVCHDNTKSFNTSSSIFFDFQEQAVRLSGLSKRSYTNSLKAVESMLEVQDKCTIRELAVQFGCTGAMTLAQQALDRYHKLHIVFQKQISI